MTDKSLEAHFIKCLKEGNTKKALYIVELLGDKVNALYGAKSLLCWAKEFENDEVARVLEEKGAREIISDEEAKKLGIELVEKAEKGDLDAVIELIEKGAKVDEKNMWNHTALIQASAGGHVDIVKALLSRGAKVDEKDSIDYTALIWASEKMHVEVVKTLIENGAKVDEKNDRGETALIMASCYGYVEVVKALLDAGADVTIANNDGITAINCTRNYEIKKMLREALRKQKEKQNEKTFINKISGFFGR